MLEHVGTVTLEDFCSTSHRLVDAAARVANLRGMRQNRNTRWADSSGCTTPPWDSRQTPQIAAMVFKYLEGKACALAKQRANMIYIYILCENSVFHWEALTIGKIRR